MEEEQQEIRRLSVSQIGSFLRCARAWGYRYLLGFKSPPTWNMVGGSSVGRTLELNNLEKMVSRSFPVSVVTDMFVEDLKRRAEEEDPVGSGSLNTTKDDGARALAAYMQQLDPDINPVGAEVEVTPTIAGHPFLGFIDVLNSVGDHTAVYDYKFTSRRPDPNAARFSFQLWSYDIGYNDPSHHVGLVHLVRTKTPQIIVQPHFVTPEDRATATRVVQGVSKSIANAVYPMVDPRNTMVCSPTQCGFWNICRGREGGPLELPGEVTFDETEV